MKTLNLFQIDKMASEPNEGSHVPSGGHDDESYGLKSKSLLTPSKEILIVVKIQDDISEMENTEVLEEQATLSRKKRNTENRATREQAGHPRKEDAESLNQGGERATYSSMEGDPENPLMETITLDKIGRN